MSAVPATLTVQDTMADQASVVGLIVGGRDDCACCSKELDGRPCILFEDGAGTTVCLTCFDTSFDQGISEVIA
jgi:hypothetical protein